MSLPISNPLFIDWTSILCCPYKSTKISMKIRNYITILLVLVIFTPLSASASKTLYYNGQIFTAITDKVDANWFVVDDGKFIAVGKGKNVPEEWQSIPNKIDLEKQFVSSGFVDAHVHFVDGGLTLLQTDLGKVTSENEIVFLLKKAKEKPLGKWIIARNAPPEYETLSRALHNFQNVPVFIALQGGHHVYINDTGLKILKINKKTNILIDEDAWDALQKVYSEIPNKDLDQAIQMAEQLALSLGITAIGDNTFFPHHMAEYLRLKKHDAFHLRVAARSFGSTVITRHLMTGIGRNFIGKKDDSVQYFGEKFYMDGPLSIPNSSYPGGPPKLSEKQLKKIFLFADPYGLAFHTQGLEGAKSLIAVRNKISHRRKSKLPDIIDHCGSCGLGVSQEIKKSGFKVTLLPMQFLDMPNLIHTFGDEYIPKLLPFRDIFDSQLEPALTTDWPYGSVNAIASQTALSPLASVAIATSGSTPDGKKIPYTENKLITVPEAMMGITNYGAKAIGRNADLGTITPGHFADFVILDKSPFDGDSQDIYNINVNSTYISGAKVYDKKQNTKQANYEFKYDPRGFTPSPVIGYDPTLGAILGGAIFSYPYRDKGMIANLQLMAAPEQPSAKAFANLEYLNLFPDISGLLSFEVDTFRYNYYGVGMGTSSNRLFETKPAHALFKAGPKLKFSNNLFLTGQVIYDYLNDQNADLIIQQSGRFENMVNGSSSAFKFEFGQDDRDADFSTRYGGQRILWVEPWVLQASKLKPRFQMGTHITQFVPLYAPNLILALRFDGAISLGNVAYTTNYALGGINTLRGYYSNRFRGDNYALISTELRFPIWNFISGVAFVDSGKVWVSGMRNKPSDIAYCGGGGLRFGLPPDFRIKLRFDVGVAPDQWGIFFAFNEAF